MRKRCCIVGLWVKVGVIRCVIVMIFARFFLRPVSGPGSRDWIWGPSSPGSRDQRHRVYRSIRSRQPGLNLGAFQSRQLQLNINFPVSLSPVILFQPYSSQSIVTCMPQFPSRLKCWIISGMLVSVSDCNVTCMPICRMNCVWKHCLLSTENYTWRNFSRFYATVLFILVPQPLLITSLRTNV